MKNLYASLLFAAVCLGYFGHSQRTEPMLKKLWKYYNQQQADSIYLLTDASFQKSISQTAFTQVLTNQLFPFGHVTGVAFLGTDLNQVDSFKASTEKGAIMLLRLKANTDESLSFLSFSPWKAGLETKQQPLHDNALSTTLDSTVHQLAMQYLQQSHAPGMSLALLKGTKAYFYNYGWARAETEQHPTAQTLYDLGSMSQIFTTFLLADAITSNQLQAGDLLIKYLPPSVAKNKALNGITLQMLANHSSGIPNFSEEEKTPTHYPELSVLYEYLQKVKLLHAPGIKYSFSQINYLLLNSILEQVYQQLIEQLLQEKIFQPFQLKSTFSGSIPDTTLAAQPHHVSGKTLPFLTGKNGKPMASIMSNTADLVRLAMQFSLKPKNAKRETDARVTLLENSALVLESQVVGLGWNFNQKDSNNRIMQNLGTGYGFGSYMAVCADRQLAVMVLVNSDAAPAPDSIGKALMESQMQMP